MRMIIVTRGYGCHFHATAYLCELSGILYADNPVLEMFFGG